MILFLNIILLSVSHIRHTSQYILDTLTWSKNPAEIPFTHNDGTPMLLLYHYHVKPPYYINATVELYNPLGFVVYFRTELYPRVIFCDFEAVVNEPIINHTYVFGYPIDAPFSFIETGVNKSIWRFVDLKTKLEIGDTLYYWISYVVEGPLINHRVLAYESQIDYALPITEKEMKNRTRMQ